LVTRRGRVGLFGIDIDALTMTEAVQRILSWVAASDGADAPAPACRMVVTPNLHHLVLLRRVPALRAAYAGADLVLADGMPLIIGSRLFRRALPERVAGADLVPALFSAAARAGPRPLRVFLLGAGPGIAEAAGARCGARWPHVEVVGTAGPTVGFEDDAEANERVVAAVVASRADVVVVGLGAPKQELWVAAMRDRLQPAVCLCVGATIDFLGGRTVRAPRWMRAAGLEWAHRLASDPKRLARRYGRDALEVPLLVGGELLRSWGPRRAAWRRSRPEAPVIDLREPPVELGSALDRRPEPSGSERDAEQDRRS